MQVRLPTGRLMRVEQDGWLRPFDMPTVMWPAGFLLAQWASGACIEKAPARGALTLVTDFQMCMMASTILGEVKKQNNSMIYVKQL